MAAQRSNIKVLAVEDDPNVLETLWTFLQEEGYQVAAARNGAEALGFLRQGFIPHLIIADILMPEMDGFELCRTVRQDKTLANISFLFLTAMSQPDDRMKGYWAGGDDYMTKPFSLSELAVKINTLLDIRFQKKPRAVFCAALNGVATWMMEEGDSLPNCLNVGQCDPEEKARSCTMGKAYPSL